MSPEFILISAVLITILVSAFCSMMEAALYAVPHSFVRALREKGFHSGEILEQFKSNVGRPISAILILNTISNTGGASLAGWAAARVFDNDLSAVAFSVVFILAILYCSEIIPKIFGVVYCRPVSRFIARPLNVIVLLLKPLIAVSQGISKKLEAGSQQPLISLEEVLSVTSLGSEEGALDKLESSVIANVIHLDTLKVKDILTPRVVVFRLADDTPLGELQEGIAEWTFSRVPLFDPESPEDLISYVTQRDVYRLLLSSEREKLLRELARPIHTVPELMPADKLLLELLEKKEHICAVVDEHGSLAGIVTLEDVLEEIVGREIVDEYDSVRDMRKYAKLFRLMATRRRGRKLGVKPRKSKTE